VPRQTLGLKVSQKGAVSVYGLQRFPVTLYASQWMALLDNRDEIIRFIQEHGANLKHRTENDGATESTS